MVEPDGLLKRAQRHPDFYAAVILLAALSLWPVWSVRFLPMQDYPQHLFIAYVTATFEDQSLAWGRFYQANLAVKPYMLTYLIERFLASFLDIEVAGKLVVSSFIILTSVLVVKNAAKCDGQNVPWGLLILFPLIFNQIYYMGFQSYLLSLPILFLALMDLDSFVSRPLSTRSVTQHLIYQALLLLSHPYSALVYLGLAGASLPFYWRSRDAFWRAVMAPLFLGFVIGAWYLGLPGPDAANPASVWGMRWWSFLETLSYFFLMFQGKGSIAEGWPPEFLLWIFIWV